jgi:hypothetical protein
MKAKSARRSERLAEALKANLKRRKEGAAKVSPNRARDAVQAPHPGPKEAAKQG